MEPYLIAIDCDGTLVGKDLTLHQRTVETIKALVKRGHFVVLASGRPYRSLAPYVKELGLEEMPLVTYNGAHAVIPKDPSFVYKKAFPLLETMEIAQKLLPEVDSLLIDDGRRAYLKEEDLYLNQFFPYEELPHAINAESPELFADPYVIVFKRKSQIDEPYKSIIEAYPSLLYRPWRDSLYAEAYIEGSDKGKALKAILACLGMDKDHVVAVGDSDNDIPMLEAAGHPFRMPESQQPGLLPYLAAPATAIDDGVAKLLESLPYLR